MQPWTISILGVVALSLAVPSGAEARLRFAPGVVLGAVAGAMFGGFAADEPTVATQCVSRADLRDILARCRR